mgnify:FL=1
MHLNTIKPAAGSKKKPKRLGRGIGSGSGKTCGRGHKGQKSRSGGFHKVGFEGGQMPLHRRLPKRGFTALKSNFTESLRLGDINKLNVERVNLSTLKENGLIRGLTRRVKVFASGNISKALKFEGIFVTKSVREAILKAGGTVEVESPENGKG